MEKKLNFFAKYLPVEGEIKKGDYYIDNSLGKNTIHLCRSTPSEDLNSTDLICKKVKLFLCSRDIKAGDKVIYNNKEYEVTSDSLITVKNNKNTYKVIGEISPEATWVKEDDEFDKGEIKVEPEIYLNEKLVKNKWVRIKGPCGHFH